MELVLPIYTKNFYHGKHFVYRYRARTETDVPRYPSHSKSGRHYETATSRAKYVRVNGVTCGKSFTNMIPICDKEIVIEREEYLILIAELKRMIVLESLT